MENRMMEPVFNETLNDTRKFAELYSKLPREKKEVVIAFMTGMETQERLSSTRASEVPV